MAPFFWPYNIHGIRGGKSSKITIPEIKKNELSEGKKTQRFRIKGQKQRDYKMHVRKGVSHRSAEKGGKLGPHTDLTEAALAKGTIKKEGRGALASE